MGVVTQEEARAVAARGAAICLCADDFGLNGGVTDGIHRLVEMGRLHAVGSMVGAPAWASSVAVLRGFPADVDVGLHLDFTEHPLEVRNGRALWPLIRQCYLAQPDRRAIRLEIRSQLDAFEAGAGRAPAFVDGHQHVHQLPVIREELVDELDARYGGRRPWLRFTGFRTRASAAGGVATLIKSAVIASLGSSPLAAAAQRRGFAMNRALLGVYDFAGDAARYAALLKAWLHAARDGDLLMCHPGHAIVDADAIAKAREAEFEVLSGDGFQRMLNELGVVLQPMSRLLATSA